MDFNNKKEYFCQRFVDGWFKCQTGTNNRNSSNKRIAAGGLKCVVVKQKQNEDADVVSEFTTQSNILK
jgi:hypothetical protein